MLVRFLSNCPKTGKVGILCQQGLRGSLTYHNWGVDLSQVLEYTKDLFFLDASHMVPFEFNVLRNKRSHQRICLLLLRGEREIYFYSQASRRESENNFSVFEKRKRNFKSCSPILRGEREIFLF